MESENFCRRKKTLGEGEKGRTRRGAGTLTYMPEDQNPGGKPTVTLEGVPATPNKSVTQSTSVSTGLYAEPKDALAAVRNDYHYWTGKLTEASFHLSLSIIAANWAVFGNKDSVPKSSWSRVSIAAALISLGVSLIAAKKMGEMLGQRIEYAEADTERWRAEFEATSNTEDPWPYTKPINCYARFFRECKIWLPLGAGILFLLALYFD